MPLSKADIRKQLKRQGSTGIAEPGRALSKAERQMSRADSAIPSLDGQDDDGAKRAAEEREDYERSFTALWHKVLSAHHQWPWLSRLSLFIDDNFAPGAAASTLEHLRIEARPWELRPCIVFWIMFLIVFGSLWNLTNHLLFASRASACNATTVSTVFIPVTQTVTAVSFDTSAASVLASPVTDNSTSSFSSTFSFSSTSTQTVTSVVTVGPASSSSTLPFVYTIDPAGSTVWVNGVSPSSGVSLVTATTSVYLSPAQEGATALDSISTTLEMAYITAPTYTSTVYSYVSPDITRTSTSTSTHFVTYTLTQVNPGSSGSAVRSSFSGIASGGWNASSSAIPAIQPAAQSSMEPESITLTSVCFERANSEQSTSTTTSWITTTIALQYTTTVMPSDPAQDAGGYVTTITALPVTISAYGGSVLASPAATESTPAPTSLSMAASSSTGSIVGAITATMSSAPLWSTSTSTATLTSSLVANTTSAEASTPAASIATTVSNLQSYSAPASSLNSTSATVALTSSKPSQSSSQVQINPTISLQPSSLASNQSTQITQTMTVVSSLISTSTLVPLNSSILRSATSASTLASGTTRLSVSAQVASTGKASTLSTSSMRAISSGLSHPTNSSMPASSGSKTKTASSPAGTGLTRSTSGSLTTSSSSSQSLAGSSESTSTKSGPRKSSLSQTGSLHTEKTSSLSLSAHSTAKSSSSASALSGSPTSSQTAASAASDSVTSSAHSSSSSSSQSVPTTYGSSMSTMVTSSSLSANATSTNPFPASSATATPSAGCGEHGNFTINFDDLPNFTPTDKNRKRTDITQAPPINAVMDPYHYLTFSDGYVYAPQPAEPYTPKSSPHLAVFLGNATGFKSGPPPSGDYVKPGEFGDGPRESMSAFWFDAYSAEFGCDNRGPDVCTIVFSAYTWSLASKTEVLTFQQNETVPPCHRSKDCQLHKLDFPTSFRGLTGLEMQAFVGQEQRMFFMDDLALRWANSTCAAGLQRQSSQ